MLEIQTIITPVDFSDNAEMIAESAAYTASKFGAELHLVFVVQNFEDYSGFFVPPVNLPNLEEELLKSAQQRMDEFITDKKEEFLQAGVKAVHSKVLTGDVSEEILGEDLVGKQIPLRDRMLPMIAVFILIFETLGLANLLSGEIEARTLQAILITPLRVRELFTGKSITGIGMAFSQALILVAVTGGLSNQAGIVLLALFLGALLATGVGFLLRRRRTTRGHL